MSGVRYFEENTSLSLVIHMLEWRAGIYVKKLRALKIENNQKFQIDRMSSRKFNLKLCTHIAKDFDI